MSYTFLVFKNKKMLNKMQVTDIDYEIFSLPKKEVRITDKYMLWDKTLRIKIKWKVIKHEVPLEGINVPNVDDITQKDIENDMKQ